MFRINGLQCNVFFLGLQQSFEKSFEVTTSQTMTRRIMEGTTSMQQTAISNTLTTPPGYYQVNFSFQFNSIQFNSIQFNSIQFNSIQFNSIQFNSIQFNS